MDLSSRLLLLLEVAELGSFTKVAELRNVDRSVISKQISRLEGELKVRLLNRSTRSLSLTGPGMEVIRQAQVLRDVLAETKRLAQTYHTEPRGMLRITCTNAFGRTYINDAALSFQQRYPEIEIDLQLEDRVVDLVGEGFDVAFRIGSFRDSSLMTQKIARNRTLIVASPDFLVRHGTPKTPADIERLPAVVFAGGGIVGDRLQYYDDKGDKNILKFRPVYRVNEDEMILNAAIAGVGIAPIVSCIIGDEIETGRLVPILTDFQLLDYGAFYVTYPHRSPPLKTKLFIAHIREIIGQDQAVWERRIPNFAQLYKNGATQ